MWADISYALRGMRRSPGFTLVAILSLALGIGANTAIFSLVETVMLRMLPVSHPDELVELLQKYPGEPRGNGYWTWRSYEYYRDHNHVFSALTGTSIDNLVRFTGPGMEPEVLAGEYVLGDYFAELGVRPALGRLIGAENTTAGPENAVAVVSYSWWSNRFHRDPAIIGKRILVQDVPVSVIGVAPRGFTGLRLEAETSVWLPRKPDSKMGLALLARLKPGTTLEQARAEMSVLYQFTIQERAANSKDPQVRNLTVNVEPAGTGLSTVRDRIGQPLTVLMAVVSLLLLLACVNLASMLLARAAGREREMAVRTSLGASRWRLLRQVLTESLILSIAGTVAGLFVAYAGATWLLDILASARPLERVLLKIHPDLNTFLFTAGVAVVAGLLFGSAPAWSAFRSAPVDSLRQAGRGAETRGARLLGRSLVAAQVALSTLLLSAGALFVVHLANLERTDLGFRRDHVLLVTLDASRSGYDREHLARTYEQLSHRLEDVPGVLSASLSAPTPLHGGGAAGFADFEGFQERPEDRRYTSIAYVAPKYFETLGTAVLSGREFRFDDPDSGRVAIINQTLARHYFPGRDPVGRHLTLDHVTGERESRTYEIVGVVGDANYMEIREPARRTIYLPAFRDGAVSANTFVVRTRINPTSVASDVRRMMQSVVPAAPISHVITLDEQIDATIVPERLIASLSGAFGAIAGLLVGIGLYGLLAYNVSRRTNEIGIRMALGATGGRLIRMVLADALLMVIAGFVLSVPMAAWGRSIASTLVQEMNIPTVIPIISAVIAMLAVALVAAYLPARRAARVEPVEALRHE
jgi:predicted permease